MIDWNKPVQTKCGYPVRIYQRYDSIVGGEGPVHGAYMCAGKWYLYSWKLLGKSVIPDLNLINVPEEFERVVWVNIYSEDMEALLEQRVSHFFYPTKEEAQKASCNILITIPIILKGTIEYKGE